MNSVDTHQRSPFACDAGSEHWMNRNIRQSDTPDGTPPHSSMCFSNDKISKNMIYSYHVS